MRDDSNFESDWFFLLAKLFHDFFFRYIGGLQTKTRHL